MLSVNGITGTGSSSLTKSSSFSNEIDKDFFLKMLVAQLKYQDPLSPVDNNEYMNQTVQFSTLEAIQALNDKLTFSLNQNKAYSFLGKYVGTYAYNKTTEETEYVKGVVDSISIAGNEIYLNIGDNYIAAPESVLMVKNEPPNADEQ